MNGKEIQGIHHVTAIAGDPQRTVDFYCGILGLRLVKRTVNFDDPGTYHLYFGDDRGRPGTILTFFPWAGLANGERGAGQVGEVAFAAPEGALGYWIERLDRHGIAVKAPHPRFAEEVLSFFDPDRLALEIVARADAGDRPFWNGAGIPAKAALRGFASVTLCEGRPEPTAAFLTQTLGLRQVAEEGDRVRFEVGKGGPGAALDLVTPAQDHGGRMGRGSVHHLAWRVADEEAQLGWRQRIAAQGVQVTPVIDRHYFRSIYFREPGGVLFEIATDPPGFTVDETVEELGSSLKLPPWLEPKRPQVERLLPQIRMPVTA